MSFKLFCDFRDKCILHYDSVHTFLVLYVHLYSQSKSFIKQYISLGCVMHSDTDYSNSLKKLLLMIQLAS